MPLKNLENPQVYSIVGAELMQEQVILDYKDAIKNVAGVNSTETVEQWPHLHYYPRFPHAATSSAMA